MKLPRLWSGGRGASRLGRNEGLLPEVFWSMQNDFEAMLRAFDRLPSLREATIVPKVDVAESQNEFDIAVELPGVDDCDVKVDVEDDQLVISGEKKEKGPHHERDWHVEERRYGSFYRRIPLPFRPEKESVEASLDKGVLNIRVWKPGQSCTHGPQRVQIRSCSVSGAPDLGAWQPAGAPQKKI